MGYAHIQVKGSEALRESHTIADTIESLIENHFGATDISIHVEPETK